MTISLMTISLSEKFFKIDEYLATLQVIVSFPFFTSFSSVLAKRTSAQTEQ